MGICVKTPATLADHWTPSHSPMLTCDGCPSNHSFVILNHGPFLPQLLDALSRTPFVDSTELAGILGEPHATGAPHPGRPANRGHRGRLSHGTAHLPSNQRYHLTANGIREAAWVLGFATPSDFVRAYPASSERLTLLIRRMDAVASIYRLAAALPPRHRWAPVPRRVPPQGSL